MCASVCAEHLEILANQGKIAYICRRVTFFLTAAAKEVIIILTEFKTCGVANKDFTRILMVNISGGALHNLRPSHTLVSDGSCVRTQA